MADAATEPEPEPPHACAVVQPGEEAPGAFRRSVYLANASGTPWGDEAVALLQEAPAFAGGDGDGGGEASVIFVGGADDSEAGCDWRRAALAMSDMALFWLPTPQDKDYSLPPCSVADFASWAPSGKVVIGLPAVAESESASSGGGGESFCRSVSWR
eukprot:SAG22_NODE_149_length_17456_cov_5.058363_1_plen_157_part_00